MNERILVTDDEAHISRAIEFKLAKAGYQVRCAADGEEAWLQLRTFRPQLLITDYQMPRLNGLQLIERLRACDDFRALPVILLTAKGFELPLAETRVQWDLADILLKPFSPRQILARVAELLSPAQAGHLPTRVEVNHAICN